MFRKKSCTNYCNQLYFNHVCRPNLTYAKIYDLGINIFRCIIDT
jgi:hypothetical protein